MPVSTGTRMPHPRMMPTSIARPTEMPTRCPTPTNAIDRLPEMPLAPAPTRKNTAASSTTSRVWLSAKKAAEASALTVMAISPCRLSSPPPREASPTTSTSAAARPSG